MASIKRDVTSKDSKELLIEAFNKLNELKEITKDLGEIFQEMEDCNEYIDTTNADVALPFSFNEWANSALKLWIEESNDNICCELGYRTFEM